MENLTGFGRNLDKLQLKRSFFISNSIKATNNFFMIKHSLLNRKAVPNSPKDPNFSEILAGTRKIFKQINTTRKSC